MCLYPGREPNPYVCNLWSAAKLCSCLVCMQNFLSRLVLSGRVLTWREFRVRCICQVGYRGGSSSKCISWEKQLHCLQMLGWRESLAGPTERDVLVYLMGNEQVRVSVQRPQALIKIQDVATSFPRSADGCVKSQQAHILWRTLWLKSDHYACLSP